MRNFTSFSALQSVFTKYNQMCQIATLKLLSDFIRVDPVICDLGNTARVMWQSGRAQILRNEPTTKPHGQPRPSATSFKQSCVPEG